MSAIRFIFFDIDGTLLDAGRTGASAFQRAWSQTFGDPDREPTLRFHGATDRGLLAQLFDAVGLEDTPQRRRRFFSEYETLLLGYLDAIDAEPLPGVWDWLERVQNNPEQLQSALLTGNCQAGAALKLRRFGLEGHFQWGAFGCEDPDRNHLARLAHQRASERSSYPVHGSEILVIGDTVRDVQCAQSVGARCLGVCTGGDEAETLRQEGADWVAPTLADAPMERILAGR